MLGWRISKAEKVYFNIYPWRNASLSMLLARGVKKLSAAPSSTLANRQASERDKGSFSVEEPFFSSLAV